MIREITAGKSLVKFPLPGEWGMIRQIFECGFELC